MTTTITPEVQAELVRLVRQELEQQSRMRRENQSVYQSILKDFQPEMERYNRHTERGVRRDGTAYDTKLDSAKYAFKIRDGLGLLLRSMYHVEYVARLPASAEPEMRRFVRGVLDLMQDVCPPEQ